MLTKAVRKGRYKIFIWFLMRIYNWWTGVVISLYALYILYILLGLFLPAFITFKKIFLILVLSFKKSVSLK